MENTLLNKILKQPFQTLVLIGNTEEIVASIDFFIKEDEQIDVYNHGDIMLHTIDSITIDLAREIKVWTEAMPQYRTRKLLILAPTLFPHLSQNTLLKTFEEPSGSTQIILIVKDISILLPTILSRAVVYDFTSEKKSSNCDFLKFSPVVRLNSENVQILLKTGVQKPTKEQVGNFFENLVQTILHAPYSEKDKRDAVAVLTTVTPYMHDQGASVKMLVEYCCLQLPRLKN